MGQPDDDNSFLGHVFPPLPPDDQVVAERGSDAARSPSPEERAELERRAAEQAERERVEAEQRAAEAERARIEAERRAAEQAERDRAEAARLEAERVEAEERRKAQLVRERAVVEEAVKRSSLVWVATDTAPGGRAVWHVALDGRLYLVTGGDEQPDPGLVPDGAATVIVRSKDTGGRLVSLHVAVSELTADDDDWTAATTELAKARLNLPEAETASSRWADRSTYRLFRLSPTDEPLAEGPREHSAASLRATPVPTPATTAGRKPWVVHQRGGSGSALS